MVIFNLLFYERFNSFQKRICVMQMESTSEETRVLMKIRIGKLLLILNWCSLAPQSTALNIKHLSESILSHKISHDEQLNFDFQWFALEVLWLTSRWTYWSKSSTSYLTYRDVYWYNHCDYQWWLQILVTHFLCLVILFRSLR